MKVRQNHNYWIVEVQASKMLFYEAKINSLLAQVFNITDPKEVEAKVNKSFEDDVHRLWAILHTNPSDLTINDRIRIVEIIYHFKLRTEKVRNEISIEMVEEFVEHIRVYNINNQKLQNEWHIIKPQLIAEFSEKNIHNVMLILSAKYPDSFKDIFIKTLACSHWEILKPFDEGTFCVSDNPGFSCNEDGCYNFFPEDISKELDLYFPLSRDRCLRISYNGKILSNTNNVYITLTTNYEMEEINYREALTCHEMIYCDSKETLENLVKKYKLGIYSDNHFTPPPPPTA